MVGLCTGLGKVRGKPWKGSQEWKRLFPLFSLLSGPRPWAILGLGIHKECLEFIYKPVSSKLAPAPGGGGVLCLISPSCQEDWFVELRLHLTSIFRASHCLFPKASSDHGLLWKEHFSWGIAVTTS